MRYLIIPELHKSGRIHFHGVFSDVKNQSLSPAINPYTGESILENNKQVYNLDNYKAIGDYAHGNKPTHFYNNFDN